MLKSDRARSSKQREEDKDVGEGTEEEERIEVDGWEICPTPGKGIALAKDGLPKAAWF
jgi:hypothetical protein